MSKKQILCNSCGEIFPSRNKLFSHIKEAHQSQDYKHSKLENLNNQGDKAIEIEVEDSKGPETNLDKKITTVLEDDWFRIIVKPQGLATMGAKGITVMNSDMLLIPGAIRYKKAVPCHRLDQGTGGLLICSKSKVAEKIIKLFFRHKNIRKRYSAILNGKLEPLSGDINSPISGMEALTKYEVVKYSKSEQYGWITTVNCWPITGRRHQLRKHFRDIGHSIIGDKRYSHACDWPTGWDQMFLWALEMEFPHPKRFESILKTNNIKNIEKEMVSIEHEVNKDIIMEEINDKYSKEWEDISNNKGNRIIVGIEEPEYYKTFRQQHEQDK